MKAEDLMIGDWVKCKDPRCEGHQVDLIDLGNEELGLDGEIYNFDNFEPIPLTSEILEKNGFKEDFETHGIYWRPDCRKFCIVKELDTWYFAFRSLGKTVDKSSGYICISECNYVHKLQHILKDLEIDKEIEL